jgi:hypothetical protein
MNNDRLRISPLCNSDGKAEVGQPRIVIVWGERSGRLWLRLEIDTRFRWIIKEWSLNQDGTQIAFEECAPRAVQQLWRHRETRFRFSMRGCLAPNNVCPFD